VYMQPVRAHVCARVHMHMCAHAGVHFCAHMLIRCVLHRVGYCAHMLVLCILRVLDHCAHTNSSHAPHMVGVRPLRSHLFIACSPYGGSLRSHLFIACSQDGGSLRSADGPEIILGAFLCLLGCAHSQKLHIVLLISRLLLPPFVWVCRLCARVCMRAFCMCVHACVGACLSIRRGQRVRLPARRGQRAWKGWG